MSKENIELFRSFIQAILPLLIFIFVVILFFTYRKRIEKFTSRITKIRGKIAGQEFETEIKESKIESSNESINKSTGQEPSNEKKPIVESLYHVWNAYKNNDTTKAAQIFEQIQEKELDTKKKIKNEIFHYYVKSITGNVNAIAELENYAEKIKYDDEKFEAYEYLGLSYKYGRSFEKAIGGFRKAFNSSSNEMQKSSITNYIADCYYELGKFNEAEKELLELLNSLVDDKAKCDCLKNLGELYKKQKLDFNRVIVLGKALEYEPNNTDILFNLAYSYSNCNLTAMAILHYKTLLSFNPDANYAHNNLGVAYQNFKMPIKANKEYKTALDQGNTLAGGNLASNFIFDGFYDEAKSIIDKAKNVSNYDNKINEALDDLNKKFTGENKKENEILESAKTQERFFKRYFDRQLSKTSLPINTSGDWLVANAITSTNTQTNHNFLNLVWQEGSIKIELTGSFENYNSNDIVYIDQDPTYSILRRNSKGYAYFEENFMEIKVMIIINDSYEIKEFSFARI